MEAYYPELVLILSLFAVLAHMTIIIDKIVLPLHDTYTIGNNATEIGRNSSLWAWELRRHDDTDEK